MCVCCSILQFPSQEGLRKLVGENRNFTNLVIEYLFVVCRTGRVVSFSRRISKAVQNR